MQKKWKQKLGILLLGILCSIPAISAQAGTIYDSEYVTVITAPDGRKAFTTDVGRDNSTWYPEYEDDPEEGRVVVNGIGTYAEPGTGQHDYPYMRYGNIPISEWRVAYMDHTCIHDEADATFYGMTYGVDYRTNLCHTHLLSGWNPICTDCGQTVGGCLFYMSKEAVSTLDYLDLGTAVKRTGYYYICPESNNMEQGKPLEHHCKAVSWNKYYIKYEKNAPSVSGYMADTIHMYNNAVEYNRQPITPDTKLRRNTYSREGWEFIGWNTRADGGGTSFTDEEEVWNLVEVDGGRIILYAQWKRTTSTLEIDPAGGTYQGRAGITSVTQNYNTFCQPSYYSIVPPVGAKVTFNSMGGNYVAPITGAQTFKEWSITFGHDNQGQWDEVNSKYTFLGPQDNIDRLTANYIRNSINLPTPIKENASFAGWYMDAACTEGNCVGKGGDPYTPMQDITLYAKWVTLHLEAVNNYIGNNYKGAVNLNWLQPDMYQKTYIVKQRREGEGWVQLTSSTDANNNPSVSQSFGYSGETKSYTVPYTGLYTLTAAGAQGGSYGVYSGGLGGSTSGNFWLTAGEVLTYTVGGQNGYNGGGSASMYAGGGGCTTVISNLQGTLLIAGGGGGATSQGNGGAGGSTTSNVASGNVGESGEAGGGGGCLGGKKGEVIVHHHEDGDDKCRHIHTGDSDSGTGCYSGPVQYCTARKENGEIISWAYDCRHFTCDGRQCGSSSCLQLHDNTCGFCGAEGLNHVKTLYKSQCLLCGKLYVPDQDDYQTIWECNNYLGHTLTCGRTEEYICGKTEGQIISSNPGYGGSNYINGAASSHTDYAGTQAGDGSFTITGQFLGFQMANRLDDAAAPDLAAPNTPAIREQLEEVIPGSRVRVTWYVPEEDTPVAGNGTRGDNGTKYYHQVFSYLVQNGTVSDTGLYSNVTENTLVTGVKGYYYYLAGTQGYRPAEEWSYLDKSQTWIDADLKTTSQYLHVAAVDVAGNISDFAIKEIPPKERAEVEWSIVTAPVTIEEGENVYRNPGSGIYYVRADGETPFLLRFSGTIQGNATDRYQIDRLSLQIENSGVQRVDVTIPKEPVDGVESFLYMGLEKRITEPEYFMDAAYTKAERSSDRQYVVLQQKFTVDDAQSGQIFRNIPRAAVSGSRESVESDDRMNALSFIADGEAPVITGTEILNDMDIIDRDAGDTILSLQAADALSGLRELKVYIQNKDNYSERTYTADSSGQLIINITQEDYLFNGDFSMLITASDNVGNVREENYNALEFFLQAKLERILEPHTPVFKCGESGLVSVLVGGYADKLEIKFPAEMETETVYSTVYVYECPDYLQEENIRFMVPLYTEEKEYIIIVTAYKEGREMQTRELPFSVNGTVLAEMRTRIR